MVKKRIFQMKTNTKNFITILTIFQALISCRGFESLKGKSQIQLVMRVFGGERGKRLGKIQKNPEGQPY